MTFGFPKQLRLLRPREFDRVFSQRCSSAESGLVVFAARNELDHPRLGLAVSRKVGHAVARNRWKRALREAFRLSQAELPALDLVCVPRHGGEPDVQQLREILHRLASRLEKRLPSTKQALSRRGERPGG